MKTTWNLKDLFESDKALENGIKKAYDDAKSFNKKYKRNIKSLNLDEIKKMFFDFEEIEELSGRIETYIDLVFTSDTTKNISLSKYKNNLLEINTLLLFFDVELSKLSKDRLKALAIDMPKYRHFLTKLINEKRHMLSEKEENIMLKKSETSRDAFVGLFDEYSNDIEYKLDKNVISQEELLAKLYSKDRDVRRKSAKSLSESLEKNAKTLVNIYNNIRKDLRIEQEIRGYRYPESYMHNSNSISKKSVDALVKTVNNNTNLVSRYYKMKQKLLKLPKLYDYDRYAPIYETKSKFSYEESQKIVLESFYGFDKEFGDIAKKAFEENWIDSHPRKNKVSGAFSHGATVKTHPYMLLNHTDGIRDVFTMAHEIGHTIHQYLSRSAGVIGHSTPLVIAEMASIFAENILFNHLKNRLDKDELKFVYTYKIESIFATLYRQIVFTNFERRVHAIKNDLELKEYNEIWQEENQKMFGKSLELTDEYKVLWSYIPHFVHTPFYCYSYSFAQLLVLVIYSIYDKGTENFNTIYKEVLSLGGSESPKDLLSKFEQNIDSSQFWNLGIKEVERIISEFEKL